LVANLIIIVDVYSISQTFSKETQSDANIIIDVPAFTDRAKQDFIKLKTSLGPEATRGFPSLLQGQLVMAQAGAAGRLLTIADDDDESAATVGEMKLLSAAGDIKARLLKLQKEFLTPVVDGLNDRIQDKPVARWLRDIFDYRRAPLEKRKRRICYLRRGVTAPSTSSA